MKSKCLLFKPHSLWYFVIAAWMDQDSPGDCFTNYPEIWSTPLCLTSSSPDLCLPGPHTSDAHHLLRGYMLDTFLWIHPWLSLLGSLGLALWIQQLSFRWKQPLSHTIQQDSSQPTGVHPRPQSSQLWKKDVETDSWRFPTGSTWLGSEYYWDIQNLCCFSFSEWNLWHQPGDRWLWRDEPHRGTETLC